MRRLTDHISLINCEITIAGLFTIITIIVFAHVLNLFYQGPENKYVLWCGRTILDPLLLIVNILIPLGLIFHLATLVSCHVYNKNYFYLNFIHSILFILLLVVSIIIGIHYCITKLEGASFTSYVWWLNFMK